MKSASTVVPVILGLLLMKWMAKAEKQTDSVVDTQSHTNPHISVFQPAHNNRELHIHIILKRICNTPDGRNPASWYKSSALCT